MCNRRPIHNRALFELCERPAEREALRRLGRRFSIDRELMIAELPERRRNRGAPRWLPWPFWALLGLAVFGLIQLVW